MNTCSYQSKMLTLYRLACIVRCNIELCVLEHITGNDAVVREKSEEDFSARIRTMAPELCELRGVPRNSS